MRRIQLLASLVVSIGLASAAVASGCAAGSENSTVSGASGPGSGPGGQGGAGGGHGGASGHGGMAGAGGAAGQGGAGGEGGAACTTEVCDGLDNDCDGVVDEACDCLEGEKQDCYTADPATANVGECKSGTQVCDSFGHFGPCVGETVPTAESCNGRDDDCDGASDDGFGQITCGMGACQVTVQACENGTPGVCVPLPPAAAEACEGTDDDCDGEVDEGCTCLDGTTQSCYPGPSGTEGTGECKAGTQTCAGGVWGDCVSAVLPAEEACNGKDDDCDTQTDEGLGTSVCGTGACQVTVDNCANGAPQICVAGRPTAETCNGIDDDCDVQIDEDLGTLSCGLGECANTVAACVGGQTQQCIPGPSAPEACDGKDNDCDGLVDDGNPGGNLTCNTGNPGLCAAGTTACAGGAIVCNQNTQPGAEACNAKDDDCDGQTDENDPGGGLSCSTGKPGICAAGTTACASGAIVCNQNTPAGTESCDGLDDDCDGAVDEGNPGGGVNCNTGKPGVCAAGITACSGGALLCNQNVPSSTEICDSKDNDCDGSSDENNPGGGVTCNTGKLGICAAGTTACTAGQIVCNQNNGASTEVCDGADNDCDGASDENNPGGGVACSTGKLGVCAAGISACSAGQLVCNQSVPSSTESCDGKDNDCDGQSDENNPGGGVACNTGKPGVCAAGTTSCTGGQVVCNQNNSAGVEVCDGIDNDCDGAVDEGNPGGGAACSTGKPGVCAAGISACTAGQLVCNQTVQPSAEVCDGLDDDCDGATDEGNPEGGQTCNTGKLGICAPGTTACSAGKVICNQNAQPSAETCDGKDNDCNGAVDNGNPGGGFACNTGLFGICAAGTTVCAGGALACSQNAQPAVEVCDGLDNNCNGASDEGNPGGGQACNTGKAGICGPGTTVCAGGALACNQNVQPTGEVCDGLDNNCNGASDEGNPGGGLACNTGKPGICASGTTLCASGALACNQNASPQNELCDSVDNNCNGQIDEMDPNPACSAQNPSAGFVSAWACTSGFCQLASCQPGYANIDGAVANGCECQTDVWSNSCQSSATLNVAVGASVDMVGKIEGAASSDWVTFTFVDKGVGQNYHPKVQLVDNAAGQFAMDVMQDCSTVATCAPAGDGNNTENGSGVLVWEQDISKYVPGPGCCSDQTPHITSVRVRVYRKNGDTPTCTTYKVTATNP